MEFDVRLSRDGVPVLLHDETLRRVQRRPERVDALDAVTLADAGIPTLAGVLDALPADVFLDVELKGDAHGEPTAAVLRTARGEAPDRALVSSFEPATLDTMRTLLPGWRRWLNAEDLRPPRCRWRSASAAAASRRCGAGSRPQRSRRGG